MSLWKINISLLFRPSVIRGPWISLLGFQDAIKAKRNTRSSAVVPTTPKKHSQGNEDSIKCQELNMHDLD
jgi:hypothetical protein